MKQTVVIAAFQYSGRRYAIEELRIQNISAIYVGNIVRKYVINNNTDSLATTTLNTNYSKEYVNCIKDNIGKVDYIFIDAIMESELREAIRKADIRYILVYPTRAMRDTFIGRAYKNAIENEFIKRNIEMVLELLYENWHSWIDICERNSDAIKVCNISYDLLYLIELVYKIEQLKYTNSEEYSKLTNIGSRDTKVISAFPATGKTYATEKLTKLGYKVLDSDSSNFSWVTSTDRVIRNPNFPANYIKHIKDNIGKVDFIFVSSHEEVRKAMQEAGIKYSLVYPNRKALKEWIGRCYLRELEGKQTFPIETMVKNWDKWIDTCKDDKYCTNRYILQLHNSYLYDVIPKISMK